MQQLIHEVFLPHLSPSGKAADHDGALLEVSRSKLAFTTDSYVVQPYFFPGGDIGSLAVFGTINDLAMCGAHPLYLSAGFILEEGFPIGDLQRILRSMEKVLSECNVTIVTGDTKVVDRGKGDGIYINTAGIGIREHDQTWNPRQIKPGDAILISGDIGRHGIAVMSVRHGLEFETEIKSDAASLWNPVSALLAAGIEAHCLRDLTRGGLSSAVNEIAQASGLTIHLEEKHIPVREDVVAACEMLGYDPLYVACEGRFLAFLPAEQVEDALRVLRNHPTTSNAAVIGEALSGRPGRVTLLNTIGVERILDMLSGEQLPRIC